MPSKSKKISKTKHDRRKPAVYVEKMTVSYDDFLAIDNISFSIAQGSIVGMIGPNGSGKTTLIRAILGLIPYQEGEVLIFGKHLSEMRDMVGYVPQRFSFDRTFPITVEEFMFLKCPRDQSIALINEKIEEVGLKKEILKSRLGVLSGGQLQRVLIAQTILNNPSLIFMDEPAAGIDIAGEATFYDIIRHLNKEHGTTIILVSHDITVVTKHVDTVLCINHELLCCGTPRKVLSPKTITKLYGKEHEIFEHEAHS